MLIIKKYQMDKFNEFFKSQFLISMLEIYPNSNYNQILFIVNEALNYRIETEILVSKYIKLYLSNIQLFTVKPQWMSYTLMSRNFSNEDKLYHIEKNIKER